MEEPTAIAGGHGARDAETYAVIGAGMAVHRELGCGFLEPVYHEALAIELSIRAIPFEMQRALPVQYRGRLLKRRYVVDFVCFNGLLVELKALRHLSTMEEAQVINYLTASRLHRALVLNFGTPRLEWKRLVRDFRESDATVETEGGAYRIAR